MRTFGRNNYTTPCAARTSAPERTLHALEFDKRLDVLKLQFAPRSDQQITIRPERVGDKRGIDCAGNRGSPPLKVVDQFVLWLLRRHVGVDHHKPILDRNSV